MNSLDGNTETWTNWSMYSYYFIPMIAINGQSIVHDVIKTKNSERFVVDYNASNAYRRQPLVYNFSEPIPTNWQLTIQNNLSYSGIENAKSVDKDSRTCAKR